MDDTNTNETDEKKKPIETPDIESEAKAAAASASSVTQRALDFAFGIGLLTAESLNWFAERINEASKQMQDQAPDFIREMQEKGRPTRERVLAELQENLFAPLKSGVENLEDRAEQVVEDTKDKVNDLMESEIQRLERRVRELERQIALREKDESAAATDQSDMDETKPPRTRRRTKSEDTDA